MNRINAIVILYNGDEFPERVSDIMHKVLRDSGIVEDGSGISIISIDQESLTELIGKEIAPVALSKVMVPEKNSEDEALQNAIIFIGTMCAESLIESKKDSNYRRFAIDLATKLGDEKMRNAIEIIANTKGKVTKALLNKYKMTSGAIETIRDVYGSFGWLKI